MFKSAVVVGLGEVLWDVLPARKVLGGAPANFAYMANVLGDQGIVASRIGNDELGREAYEAMGELGLNTAYIQKDDRYPTGVAEVSIASDGQPTFTINEPAAWDFLEWTPAWEELSGRADVVCFGSLAQRSPISAGTVDAFLRNAKGNALRVLDANLRQSFYSAEILCKSFQHADIVKLNDEELPRVSAMLGMGDGEAGGMAEGLLREFHLKLMCITRGARGSLLVSKDRRVEHRGFQVKVVDTVGAGDAFTACLAHYYLRGRSLEEIGESANRFASRVAMQVGATSEPDHLRASENLAGNAPSNVETLQSDAD